MMGARIIFCVFVTTYVSFEVVVEQWKRTCERERPKKHLRWGDASRILGGAECRNFKN